jgi:hypothetical protein
MVSWMVLKTWQDIGSKTQQVDNMESQQVAKDDYEFQKINWQVQLWFEDVRTSSQTTHQCRHVQVCAGTPSLFSFGYTDEIMNEKYAPTNFFRELPGLVLVFVSLFILHVWDHLCNVCSFEERLVLLAGADHRVPHRRRPTAARWTLKALNPQPNPRESGLSRFRICGPAACFPREAGLARRTVWDPRMQEVHSGCLVESCAATHEQARWQEELLQQ